MKRIISVLLILALCLSSCNYEANVSEISNENKIKISENTSITKEVENKKNIAVAVEESKSIDIKGKATESEIIKEKIAENENIEKFYSLNDKKLLQYIEDEVYANMTENFGSEDYKIESVDAIYISKEYLEELEYNSKENIYFGYTLSELDSKYTGSRYVFTIDDNGKTITKIFEKYDDTYDKVIKNVLIGSGVIVVCVVVTIFSGGIGAPHCISMLFTTSAKTAATFAASSGALSFAATAIVKGIETKNVEETLKQATLAGSDGFKWGAITGVVAGGITETLSLVKSARTIPSFRQSELTVLERTKGAKEQISFLNGKEVSCFTKGATRPDVIVKNPNGTLKAIEVKNYNLNSPNSRSTLYSELKRQVESRVKNLPKGSEQEIILDIRGRNYSKKMVNEVIDKIRICCDEFYKNIPIRILSY